MKHNRSMHHHHRETPFQITSKSHPVSYKNMRSASATKLKLITFDCTGTLLQFRTPPALVYAQIAKTHYGIQVEQDKLKQSFRKQWKLLNRTQPHFGSCWKEWWTSFVIGTFKGADIGQVEDSVLRHLSTRLIDHFRTDQCWEVKSGVVPMLNRLKQSGTSIGVISNFDPRLKEILQVLNMAHYFDFLLLSHELQMSKPDKRIFDSALRIYNGGNPSKDVRDKCLHVGDNFELDYQGAVGAGWDGCLITEDWEKYSDKVPDNRLFRSIEEFEYEVVNSGK